MPPRPGPPRIVAPRRPKTITDDERNDGVTHPADDRRPCFTSTWLEGKEGSLATTLATYHVGGVGVRLSSLPGETCARYAICPPEYSLNPAMAKMVADAIDEVTTSPPDDIDLRSMDALRPFIEGRAKDFIHRRLSSRILAPAHASTRDTVEQLAELVSKYTAGFGVLETLFEDEAVQDIYVNAPSSQTPVFVVLGPGAPGGVGQKCRTNVFVGSRDMQGIVSRVKLETGLPFSEAHPVLEADIPRLGCRMTIVGPPISERGVSIAVRKHSSEVLTLPSLVAFGTMSPLLASFLWACVLGRRTVLVAGSRGAGKTTLLGAMMLEFPLTQRILLIEDTPEIPVTRMRHYGYDIQTLRFGGEGGTSGVTAQETLRVSLRMGESAIVIGEVRGEEAKVLYESMRAGSAGSSVLGTIHGNSAQGVLNRAVEDLGITERAFSSTDIVIVIGLIRTPDGSAFCRKVVEVTEVTYGREGIGLATLFTMEPGCNCAKPTDRFSSSSKTVLGIAGALGIPPDRVIEIVRSRAHCDQHMAEDLTRQSPRQRGRVNDLRVSSNEMLVKGLFAPEGPDEALRAWEEWYGRRRTAA